LVGCYIRQYEKESNVTTIDVKKKFEHFFLKIKIIFLIFIRMIFAIEFL